MELKLPLSNGTRLLKVNNIDLDQAAYSGAALSESALTAQAYLSQYLRGGMGGGGGTLHCQTSHSRRLI